MSDVTTPPTITLRLKDWTGSPAGRTLIQGVKWDPLSHCYFINQADNVSGRKLQTNVFRRHAADGTYKGYATFVDAGHVSSFGLQPIKQGTTRIWFGHDAKGAGYVDYVQGQAAAPFVPAKGLPNGDISVDVANDLLNVRTYPMRFRTYRLSTCLSGKPVLLNDCTIPAWMDRFQGHLVAGKRLYVHRDVATKGASELRSYTLDGKALSKWNSNPWGDESQGAMEKDGWVYGVERTGGDTPNRIATCVPVERVATVVDAADPGGTWVVLADHLAGVDHRYGDKRDPVKYVRDKGFKITTGKSFITATDSQGGEHEYLLTQAGNRYALSSGPDRAGTPYLQKVSN